MRVSFELLLNIGEGEGEPKNIPEGSQNFLL